MSRRRVEQRIAIGVFAALALVAVAAITIGAHAASSDRAVTDPTPARGTRIGAAASGTPSASATTSGGAATAAASGPVDLETFVAADGSFEIRLPIVWQQVNGSGDPSTLYLENGPMQMSVRAADADGFVTTCDEPAGPWETCITSTASSLDELAELIGLTNKAERGIAPSGPVRTVMILDGEAAIVETIEAYEYPAKGAEFVKYVVAMHGGRPFVVRVWTPSGSGIEHANELLAGFSFVDGVSATEEPADGTSGPEPAPGSAPDTWFVSPDETFAIRLPAGWHLTRGSDPTALYVSSPVAKVSISIRGARTDGSIRTCDVAGASWESCTLARPQTLDDLEEAIALDGDSPDLMVGPNITDVTLDGTPARAIAASGLGGRPLIGIRYVVAMQDGRAFIVRARGRGGDIEPHLGLMPLLEGFEFRTNEPAPSMPAAEIDRLFVAPDGSFAIRLPEAWELKTGPDPSALYIGNPETRLAISIRAGDRDGWIRTCDSGGASWETCDRVRPTTLQELADSIGLDADWPTSFFGPNESAAVLAGEPASSIAIVAQLNRNSTSIPMGVHYVVVMHEGRPFIVRATQTTPAQTYLGLMPVLEGFEFR